MADTPAVSANNPKKTPAKKATGEAQFGFTDAELDTIKAILKQLSSGKVDYTLLAADLGGEISKEAARKRWERLVIKLNLKLTSSTGADAAGDNEVCILSIIFKWIYIP
jgi:hypothetical protein